MTHYPIFLPRAAKRSCFALSSNTCLDELNSRLRTMDRVQPLFFKCLSSDAIIIFAFFIVYFGVEMFEQSVKLSWLIIIFYFINKFLFYAPLSPNREPKTSAFRSVFVFRAVFQPLYSCFGGKSKYMCYKRQPLHCDFCSKLVYLTPFRWRI